MYYVAKIYKHFMPTIVECLTDYKRAKQLAEILSAEKGEEYVVLEMK